jgi:hypothetical protein
VRGQAEGIGADDESVTGPRDRSLGDDADEVEGWPPVMLLATVDGESRGVLDRELRRR